jgi:hypothetical protein
VVSGSQRRTLAASVFGQALTAPASLKGSRSLAEATRGLTAGLGQWAVSAKGLLKARLGATGGAFIVHGPPVALTLVIANIVITPLFAETLSAAEVHSQTSPNRRFSRFSAASRDGA